MPRRGRRAKKRRNQRRKKKNEAALRAEIRSAMITEKGNASPIALRLAWHSSGTYDARTGKYGNNGARMRFEPEISDGANNGLDIMRRILRPVINNNPEVSISDIWTYAGKCAIEFTGGPTIPYNFGRIDARDGSGCPAHGNLPDAAKGAQHLRDVFYRQGFNDRQIVALSGGHTLGRCNISRSGFDGPWTSNPHTFDNSYFTALLDNKWVKKIVPESGNLQYVDAATGKLMMLPSDLALLSDPIFRKVVEEYAQDEGSFFRDFAAAFGQMLNNGHPGKQRARL